jgi:hypothetical protein
MKDTPFSPLRIAWFSPVAATSLRKSACFTRALVPLLIESGRFQIEIFTSDEDLDEAARLSSATFRASEPQGFPASLSVQTAFFRHRSHPFDIFFYQFEDHSDLAAVRRHSRLWPGLCLFHDLNLHHMHLAQFKHTTGAQDLNAAMDELFGPQSVRLGDQHVRGWPLEIYDAVYPVGRTELSLAGGCLFTTRRQRDAAAEYCSGCVLPFPIAGIGTAEVFEEQRSLRRFLDLELSRPIVGFSGLPRLADRAPHIVEVFSRLIQETARSSEEQAFLLWILPPGCNDEARQAHALCRKNNLGAEHFRVLESSSPAEFSSFHSIPQLYLAVNPDRLRSPADGLWASLIRAKACLVSSLALPELVQAHAALGIDPGRSEQAALFHTLRLLLRDKDLCRAIGRAGRHYVEKNHNVQLSAGLLAAQFEEFLPQSKRLLAEKQKRYEHSCSRLVDSPQHSEEMTSHVASSSPPEISAAIRRVFREKAAQDFCWADIIPGELS